MILRFIFSLCFILVYLLPGGALAATGTIKHNKAEKTITITDADKNLSLLIDYSSGCFIKQLLIKGHNKLSQEGIYSGVQKDANVFRSTDKTSKVQVHETHNGIILTGISYGDNELGINETWRFHLNQNQIEWDITREYDHDAQLEDMSLPKWHFAEMSTWKGGIFDNGGMVWCKYLKETGDTYGVHTGGVTFWNAESGDGLAISAAAEMGGFVGAKYSHGKSNEFNCTQLLTANPLKQRYNLSRFVSKKTDVFAPFEVKKGKVRIKLKLSAVDYFSSFSRGSLPGIDAVAVRELMNTTGRYGVVDNNIVGGNGWTSNWKCLHEPFFAQIGMAVNDENYTRNLSSTLDQERDQAMLPDGRVLSRWHNAPGDEIPGTYNFKTGYYEAMWGYTVDSQTGYLINLSEQFDINGDLHWLRTHKVSAEKSLEWLIKRDADKNGIFEMVNNNISEHKSSDWLDIVYASYENAFVNAQMYEALILWAHCEQLLGDRQKAAYYSDIALKLKTAFNKPIEEGGFWSGTKNQYVYWRDNDGSIHGDNLVTPVNFAAIAFGLCDDPDRISKILDQVEQRTQAEHLFHWPLCFDSFKREEVHDGNWPFPKYENGDIFPTWGYLGIRAYAGYDKNIALKYINNILTQYKKDCLSSQRYSRLTQSGQGDDILAGICTSITALYRDIYGIRPKWNRMGLEPNMSASLNGTVFNYNLRDTTYQIKLSVNDYSMRTKDFSIHSTQSFGASRTGNKLIYFNGNNENSTLNIAGATSKHIVLNLNSWNEEGIDWIIQSTDKYRFKLTGMRGGSVHIVKINNKDHRVTATAQGNLIFESVCSGSTRFIVR